MRDSLLIKRDSKWTWSPDSSLNLVSLATISSQEAQRCFLQARCSVPTRDRRSYASRKIERSKGYH
ncbi:unnamed protein product [Brassica napus]|uniref:(rape) hypothetical protein n=1 Tax=Brassica napus TaxID=3708 RepID=A0A816UCZ1_BRANA|nr:unnamed protein product [Brassica napus]